MPISGTQTVLAPIAPNNANDAYSTHFDTYGQGGHRVITTTAASGGTATNAQIGAQIRLDRRKIGMLIYDTQTAKYYRCTATATDGSYTVETFGAGSGSVTSVGLSMPGGFNVTNSPVTGTGTLTVSTTLSGLIKGDGSGFSAATAGTDYAAASHTHTGSQITGITGSRLLGRFASTAGAGQEIQVSTGLNLDSATGILTATGSGGTVTNISTTAPISGGPITGTGTISHANSGVVAATYGNSTTIPVFAVNATGHVTSVTDTAITGFLPLSGGTLTGSLSGTSLTLSGDLTVNGTTTNINTTNLVVEDKNVVIGDVTTPSNTTADGGGITLKGATDKTFNWVNATGAWTSSEDLNLLTGKVFEINGTTVLSATTLGSGVTGSSLTSVGTLTGGTWNATTIGLAFGGTGGNLSLVNDGSVMKKSGTSLVAATVGTDYLSDASTVDGGTY